MPVVSNTSPVLNLAIIGQLVLLREGRLASLQKAMDDLRELAGFRIGAELYASLIRESGEDE